MKYKNKLMTVAIAACLAVPTVATATNGMFAHGYGSASRGLGGAGVALPQDTLAGATNPAGMVFLGNRWDAGAEIFAPRRSYTAGAASIPDGMGPALKPTNDGTGVGSRAESENNWFVIPAFGVNKMLGNSASLGISVYGNGGMNTEYRSGDIVNNSVVAGTTSGAFGAGRAGMNMEQIFANLTYSMKLGRGMSFGGSLIGAVETLRVNGLSARHPSAGFDLFTESVQNRLAAYTGSMADFDWEAKDLANGGTDVAYGGGFKLGFQAEVSPGFNIGASYQSRMWMSDLQDYDDLLSDDELDIPPTATVGLAFRGSKDTWWLFDTQWIGYDNIDMLGRDTKGFKDNCIEPIMDASYAGLGLIRPGAITRLPLDSKHCLGGRNGPGFGWHDIFIYKIGWQWTANPEWTWRVGFSHTNHPVDSGDIALNILAPAVVETHITFGFEHKMSKNNTLGFSAMYAPKNRFSAGSTLMPSLNATRNASEDGLAAFNALGWTPDQPVSMEMAQFAIEFSWSSRF